MKILSITAQKPDSTGSGVYLTELVKGFHKLGHQQAVVAGIYQGDAVNMPKGVKVFPAYFLSGKLPFAIPGMSDEMPYKSIRYRDMSEEMVLKYQSGFLDVVGTAVRDFQPDLILCHHLYLLTATVREAFPGYKVYGFCHNTDLRQMKKTDLKREFIASQIRRLDRIFALQKAQKAEVSAVYGADEGRIELVGTGYSRDKFYVSGERKAHTAKTLVFAGKIAEKKGIISLIRCLSYLPYKRGELVLRLAGGAGNQREYERIKALAENAPYQVEFLGKLTQEELARVYNTSDVFVLPSFSEGMPLTMIEAMACGNRVVMTDIPGIREWVKEHVKNAPVRFVALPQMRNTDEAVEEALPEFERELAQKIEESLEEEEQTVPELDGVSWENICLKILKKG